MKLSLVAGVVAAALGLASSAGATQNLPNLSLTLQDARDVQTDQGWVLQANDMRIATNGPAIFRQLAFAKIRPTANAPLTSVTFTPLGSARFSGFSFRSRDIAPDQWITVSLKPRGGKLETYSYFIGDNSLAAPLLGAIDPAGRPIKWASVSTPDGFVKVKQINFSPAAVPEPATWALMLIGAAAIGAGLRMRRRGLAAA